MALRDRKCVPCEGGVAPLSKTATKGLLGQVRGWAEQHGKLRKALTFPDFREAMTFVNRVAEIAEEEGHHPDFCVHYNRVDFTIWTHAIDGLSENDFILAAKIDALAQRLNGL
jgi:4a-hydroxytetrahydrobiopterin dehydratase